MSAQLFKA